MKKTALSRRDTAEWIESFIGDYSPSACTLEGRRWVKGDRIRVYIKDTSCRSSSAQDQGYIEIKMDGTTSGSDHIKRNSSTVRAVEKMMANFHAEFEIMKQSPSGNQSYAGYYNTGSSPRYRDPDIIGSAADSES